MLRFQSRHQLFPEVFRELDEYVQRKVNFSYCTAIVTVFEFTPPMEIMTGTLGPVADVAGTCAFT